jgi:hypothetical protein
MEIKLTSPKYGDFNVYIDDSDFDIIKEYNWVVDMRRNGRKYVVASVKIGVNKFSRIYLHRLIINAPKNKNVDHIDNNGLNNTRDNIRIASNGQNLSNRGKQSNNTSGYKGVVWYNPLNKWKAQIGYGNNTKHLGYFNNILEAAKAYNDAAIIIHGDFSCLNKI